MRRPTKRSLIRNDGRGGGRADAAVVPLLKTGPLLYAYITGSLSVLYVDDIVEEVHLYCHKFL